MRDSTKDPQRNPETSNVEGKLPATGQDLTQCCVCQMPLDEKIGLGQMIAHTPCREYVALVTHEAAQRSASVERERCSSVIDAFLEQWQMSRDPAAPTVFGTLQSVDACIEEAGNV